MFHRLVLCSVLLVAASARAVAQPYAVVPLPTLPGEEFTVPTDLNNQLQVVGRAGNQAVLWDATGIHPLGITVSSSNLHINDSGVIAGVRSVDGRLRPFVWVNGLTFEPPAPAEDIDQILALTDNGMLLMQGSRSYLAFGSAVYDLTTLFGWRVFALNNSGVAGGYANGLRPFLRFSDGRTIVPWTTGTAAVDVIGNAGHFAGAPPSSSFPYVWHYGMPDGTVTTFQETGLDMRLGGINRLGDLVGSFSFTGGLRRPFLYQNGIRTDLNSLRVSGSAKLVAHPYAINDLGYIAAASRMTGPSFGLEAVVLVPVPPAAPAALTQTVTGNVVALQWSASVGALEYIVEAGSASGASNIFNASVGPQTVASAAVPAGRYYVRVRAKNAVGASAPSSEIIVNVP